MDGLVDVNLRAMSRSKPFADPNAADRLVQALLLRHHCPTPLHLLRTLFLGHIASPRLDVSPMAAVAQAWGGEQDMLLPQKAHEAVETLAELHAMFEGAAALLADETRPAPAHELKDLLKNLQKLTLVADAQINKAVQSCKRARGQGMEAMASVLTSRLGTTDGDDGELDDLDADTDDDVADDYGGSKFIDSPLCQRVTRHGVEVRIKIYGDSDDGWILEIVDAENASHVWDEPFKTDHLALAEALRALDATPLEFFGPAANRR